MSASAYRRARGKNNAIAGDQFAEAVNAAGRARHDRLVGEITLHVHGQGVGRLITAGAPLFERLHRDPVQFARQE